MPSACNRCKDYVHPAEERKALGSCWHIECFTCAVCNKSLDSVTLCECKETNEIYCRPCYKKNFALPGYGYGPNEPALISLSPTTQCCPCDEDKESQTPSEQPFIAPPSRQGQEWLRGIRRPVHYGNQVKLVNTDCCKCSGAETTGTSAQTQKPKGSTYNTQASSRKKGRGC